MSPEPESRVRELLARCDALVTGDHFVYTSGRHGSAYVNKDALYPDTSIVQEVCGLLAGTVAEFAPDVVCGPALGAIILSQWTAHILTEVTGHAVLSVYAEKCEDGAGLVLRRGYDALTRGHRVVVVEDIVNTGGSLQQAIAAVREAGGTVVAATALVDRGGCDAAALGIPAYRPLLRLDLETYAAATCPLCEAGVPVSTRLGKGARLASEERGIRA